MILTELLRSTARSLLRLKHVEILNILIKIQKLNSIVFFCRNPSSNPESKCIGPLILFLSSDLSGYHAKQMQSLNCPLIIIPSYPRH